MMGAETDISKATGFWQSYSRLTGRDEQQDPSDEDKEVCKRVGEGAHDSQLVVGSGNFGGDSG
jgi:hypothetical protein